METYNLELVRGNTKTYEIQFQKDGSPIDITGWTVFFTVKSVYDLPDTLPDAGAILKKDITSHSDPENGKTLISLSYQETATLKAGQTMLYDITVKDDSGKIYTVVLGNLVVTEKVTQRTEPTP